jgi:ribosomal protein L29
MKTRELRELGADALAVKIRESRKELAEIKLRLSSNGEAEKVSKIKKLRREIARMLTVQNEAAKKEAK